MPRISRKSLETNYYHVMVQGINKEYIFIDSNYINKYLKIISNYLKDFNISILAYCIMNNHAHLLIYTENVDCLSKFMQRVNTSYARFYNKQNKRIGYVFRDRYYSQPIYSQIQLFNCVKYIHNNPVKAKMVKRMCEYQYSSYNEFLGKKNLITNRTLILLFGTSSNYIDQFVFIHNSLNNEDFIDIDVEKNNISDFILQTQHSLGISIEDIIVDKELLKRIIIDCRSQTSATLEDLASIFGLSVSTIYRYCKKTDT